MGFLDGKAAVVTGAASGQGRATAIAAAAEGAKVVCFDVTDPQQTVDEIEAAGGVGHAVTGDIRHEADWRRAADHAVNEFGGIFLLGNIAGVTPKVDSVLEGDDSQWDQVLDINLKGVWLGMRAVLPAMMAAGEGRIVNISSLAAMVGLPNLASYSASKAGIHGLTRHAAVEYGKAGIRVNAIAPGVIDTPMNKDNPPELTAAFLANTPVGRAGQAEEIAAVVLFFASPPADFITGQVLAVDGGWSIQG
jgi:NAD(P)-dependent dehydrogenase (short-subunit alcohol dehydrogenase family)